MIAFWRLFFAGPDAVEREPHAPWSRMDTILILWLLGVAIVAALAGLPTPAAAQTHDWPARSVAVSVAAPPPGPWRATADPVDEVGEAPAYRA